MSIEVKQMIIKSTLVGDDNSSELTNDGQGVELDVETLKEEMIAACKDMIQQSIQELKER